MISLSENKSKQHFFLCYTEKLKRISVITFIIHSVRSQLEIINGVGNLSQIHAIEFFEEGSRMCVT